MFTCQRCTSRLFGTSRPSLKPIRAARPRQISSVVEKNASDLAHDSSNHTTTRTKSAKSRSHPADHGSNRPHPERNARSQSGNAVTKSGNASLTLRKTFSTHSPPQPFKVAIIGSGPAGFYTASRLLKSHPSPSSIKITMFERLPVPYGLVRYGVAPDHPEVKNCQDRFDEIAASPNFEFIGNVEVGTDVSLEALRREYDGVVFTYGASEDRLLGVEGECLRGVCSARAFVGWYNGLPGFSGQDFSLSKADSAVVIGQGNVSLDVARILLSPVDALRKTDIPEHVLQSLSESRVKRVSAVGRRGPLQAAFTIKEIRELTAIPSVAFASVPRGLFPDDVKTLPRARRRIAELLLKQTENRLEERPKTFELQFLQAPVAFVPDAAAPERLGSVTFQTQRFQDEDTRFDPAASVTAIEEFTSIATPLAFRSIGYKSTPLPGLEKLGVQFDTRRGIIPNEGGRVVAYPTSQPGIGVVPHAIPGLYAAGWVKRGPTGVIASTMEDAFATADAITQDIEGGKVVVDGEARGGWEGVRKEMGRDVRWTTWEDWRRIDRVERERGRKLGKEREKIVRVEEMLEVLDA